MLFTFACSFESGNGIKAEESGDVKNKGSENAIQTVQGSYSYTSPEGQVIQVRKSRILFLVSSSMEVILIELK